MNILIVTVVLMFRRWFLIASASFVVPVKPCKPRRDTRLLTRFSCILTAWVPVIKPHQSSILQLRTRVPSTQQSGPRHGVGNHRLSSQYSLHEHAFDWSNPNSAGTTTERQNLPTRKDDPTMTVSGQTTTARKLGAGVNRFIGIRKLR